ITIVPPTTERQERGSGLEQGWSVKGYIWTLYFPDGALAKWARNLGFWVYKVEIGFGVGTATDLRNRTSILGAGGARIEFGAAPWVLWPNDPRALELRKKYLGY